MDNYLKKFFNMDENKINIVKDNSYMRWVSSVIINKGVLFSDEDSSKIEYLYRAISDYADDNYIYPDNGEFDNYYYIKYNNKFYKIGVFAGQGVYFYIRLINDEVNNYIEFNDVVSNKRQNNTRDIDNKIDKVKYLIDSLNGMGVPIHVIKSKIEDYLYQIDYKDTKVRQLKK